MDAKPIKYLHDKNVGKYKNENGRKMHSSIIEYR
jgi:hypothetical protein